MDHRIFGKELTNLAEADINRYKRNYSFLHAERLRDHSLNVKQGNATNRLNNRTQVDVKLPDAKLELTDLQMVPEYFFENMQFLKSREKQTYKLNNYITAHKTVSEQSRAKLIDWLSELHYKYKMFPETMFTITSLIDQYLSAR
jgi:G2/mitotic-specific cyclin 1/2